ncbi:MAG: TRAP transporter substrate-binding protein DctP [Silicimonas sp.]
MNTLNLRGVALWLLAAGLLSPVYAQETVTLRFADWQARSHYTVPNMAEPFMEKATELSDGRIQFEYFPGEQLGKGKDALSLLQSNVADVANVSPAYISDKFSLSSVAELPAMFSTACEGSNALMDVATSNGALAEHEFGPLGIRVLAGATYAPYKIITVDQMVDEVSDMKGLKLRTAGGAMDMTARQVDAVSVRMPGPDVLSSLSRGTLDGALWPLLSVEPFDLQTELNHMTTDVSMGSFVTVYAISDATWEKLDDATREILVEAGEYASQNHCEYVDTAEQDVIARLEGKGMAPNTMKDGELDALREKLSAVQVNWAETLDERGQPGTEVLNAFQAALGE